MRNRAEGGGLVGGPPVRDNIPLDKRGRCVYIGIVKTHHEHRK